MKEMQKNKLFENQIYTKATQKKMFKLYPVYSRYSDRNVWANSAVTDQPPQNAVSNKGLHYLPFSHQNFR